MPVDPFFESAPREHSLIKSELVSKYFDAWSAIMLPRARGGVIGFADLFCGTGRFRSSDQEVDSTPVQIAKQVLESDRLSQHVKLFFNDKNAQHVTLLKSRIGDLESIDRLKHPPKFGNFEIGGQLLGPLAEFSSVPTLYFMDPYGYKGMSTDLVRRLISGWGSDGVFFFNYDAVNRAITNETVGPLMQDMFGQERARSLSEMVEGISSVERERLVLQAFRDTLHANGAKYTIAFRFLRPHMERTSHYIVFASKAFRGYDVMRDIMARTGRYQDELPMFEWASGARQAELNLDQPKMRAVKAMEELLLRAAAGRRGTVQQIYEELSVDTPFTKKPFKDILRGLEEKGQISIQPPASTRRRGTLADNCVITFPREGG